MEDTRNDTQEIEQEIQKELNTDAQAQIKELENEAKQAGRKPYRITDFDTPRDREMAVFTHAKKLSEYIFIITEKSPAKYRWNIITRLLNTSADVIEYLYRANYERAKTDRIEWQKKAMVALNLLDFYTETARMKFAITNRQTEIIARQIFEVKKLLSGWVRSTKDRD